MEESRYFPPVAGGVWAVSRYIEGKLVCLIERRPVDDISDIERVFRALGIAITEENQARYFPRDKSWGPCPTLELLELCAKLPPGTGREVGV